MSRRPVNDELMATPTHVEALDSSTAQSVGTPVAALATNLAALAEMQLSSLAHLRRRAVEEQPADTTHSPAAAAGAAVKTRIPKPKRTAVERTLLVDARAFDELIESHAEAAATTVVATPGSARSLLSSLKTDKPDPPQSRARSTTTDKHQQRSSSAATSAAVDDDEEEGTGGEKPTAAAKEDAEEEDEPLTVPLIDYHSVMYTGQKHVHCVVPGTVCRARCGHGSLACMLWTVLCVFVL
jgi:hypothetical protein